MQGIDDGIFVDGNPPPLAQMQNVGPTREDQLKEYLSKIMSQAQQDMPKSNDMLAQILSQTMNPSPQDVSTSLYKTAQSYMAPNLYKPATPEEASGERVKSQFEPYSELAKLRGSMPAAMQEYQYYKGLPKEEQETFLRMKRADQYLNVGGGFVDPRTGRMIEKTLPPEQLPETKGAQAKAEAAGKLDVERQAGATKAQSALSGFEQQANLVIQNVDNAINTIQKSALSTGWGAAATSWAPNTEARKLSNYLQTIKANVGFDKLQEMRNNSPTGGALGQVSDLENRLLQAVNGALDPLQKDQLVENLNTIKTLYPQVLAQKKSAFAKDYGQYVGQQETPKASEMPKKTVKFGDLP